VVSAVTLAHVTETEIPLLVELVVAGLAIGLVLGAVLVARGMIGRRR
jgi:hypothetical protein